MSSSTEANSSLRMRLRFQWWWLIWFAAGASLFLSGAVLGVVAGSGPPGQSGWFSRLFTPPFGGREEVTILVLGVDDTEGRGLADTIIAAVVRSGSREIAALAIPRDSRVSVPGAGNRRINEAHAFGELPLTVETVELLLGTPIDYHVSVNIPSLVRLVDMIGGVDLEVEKRMYYRDRAQGLLIDLYPGFQHLDGEQAVGYVRFRHDARGDLGRIERQRKFLRVVGDKLLAPENVAALQDLTESFAEVVDTNLSVRDMLALKKLVEEIGPEAIVMDTLPGHERIIGGQAMLELDEAEVQRKVDRVLWRQGVALAVMNGTSVNGLAARVAARLEARNYEVVEVGNAPEKTDTTLIIDHRGRTREAQRLAEVLHGGVISVNPDGDNPADVTLILGRDMAGGI